MGAPKRIRARNSKGMSKTLVALPTALRRKLEAIRRREGMVMGECIRQALAFWLKHRKKEDTR